MSWDTIKGFGEIFKIFGVGNALKYLLDGSIEQRVIEHVQRKNSNALLEWLVSGTMEKGFIWAISSFNHGLAKDLYPLTKEELAFLSHYFVEEEDSGKKTTDSYRLRVAISIAKMLPKFVLYRRTSRRLVELINENIEDPEKANMWFNVLEQHIKIVCEENNIDYYKPIAKNPNTNKKIFNELKFINRHLNDFLKIKKLDSLLKEKVISLVGTIGIEGPRYFIACLIKAETKYEARAAANGFFQQTEYRLRSGKYVKKVIFYVLKKCYTLPNVNRSEIMSFVDTLIKFHTKNYQEISLNLAKYLKRYSTILMGLSAKEDVIPSAILKDIKRLCDSQTAFKLLAGVFKNSEDFEKKIVAFNELILLKAKKNDKWLSEIELDKVDADSNLMKRLGLYELYGSSVETTLRNITDYENDVDFISSKFNFLLEKYFAICPECSLKRVNATFIALKKRFEPLYEQYYKQRAEVTRNFIKILDKSVDVKEKKAIIALMIGKKYCLSEWRMKNKLLRALDDLRKELKRRYKD